MLFVGNEGPSQSGSSVATIAGVVVAIVVVAAIIVVVVVLVVCIRRRRRLVIEDLKVNYYFLIMVNLILC